VQKVGDFLNKDNEKIEHRSI